MDKDRIAGSAKDIAGKLEGAVGDIAGNAQTQAAGHAREATGTVQNLYGQAKDAARDATDAAASYARDAYENSGDTLRDGSQAVAKKVRRNPLSGKVRSVPDCTPYCTTNHMGCTEPREPSTTRADEDRFPFVIAEAALFAQVLHRSREIGCKWNQAFFSTFPAQQHLRRPIQLQVSGVDADCLGHTCAGASQK